MRIALIGRSEILYETGEMLAARGHTIALIVTAKEAPEYQRTAEEFGALAERLDSPFIRSANIGSLEDRIKALPPIDLGISFNFVGVIPQTIIDCFRLGILNGHAGDLPRYRGNAPLAWAMIQGEERVAMCIHRMIGGQLDAGEIIARDYYPVSLRTTIGDLYNWMAERTPPLFCEAAALLGSDPDFVLAHQSEDPADALRCYPRRPEDGKVDWSRGTVEVLRLINASGWPYAGAFCSHAGEKLIVLAAEPVDDGENFLAVPGQVTSIGDGFIHVATGDGKVALTRIAKAGEEISPNLLIRSIRERLE